MFISKRVIGLVVSAVVCAGTDGVGADNLLATDKDVKINVPLLPSSLPVQLQSSLTTQYTANQTPDPAAGMLHVGDTALEEGIRYPALVGEIYSGNSIGGKLMPSGKDVFPMANPNSAYLTSWLSKQWASVDLSLAHVHMIEKPDEQVAVGMSKAVAVLQPALFLSVGEYLFNDLSNRYWSRTTDLTLDYGWKRWDFSMFIEQRQDPILRDQSVWATIKTKF